MANSANASACQKSLFAKLVGGGVNYPQFAMVTLLRLAACSVPLLIGLTSRCFAHRARASCAPRHCHPYQFPLKSYGFSGAETARKRFLLWKMGFSSAKIAPSPPYTPPGTIEVRKGFALLSRSPLSFLTVCGNGKFCQRLFRCMRSAKSSLCLGDFFLFNRTNLRGFDIS